MDNRERIIEKIFTAQSESGLWKTISSSDKYYPDYLHYVPNFKASLWTLILLADLELPRNDPRVSRALQEVKDHLYDSDFGIYTLKEDHFPIPCLNGNMIYLDCYFNKGPDERSLKALKFFAENQRFDDGCYVKPKNEYCSNKSCYGSHSCYWGVVKLLKGISFIPQASRTEEIQKLRGKCIDFVLLHNVCFSSHHAGKIMIDKIDRLTFPNMYKSDFLEILWLMKREEVESANLKDALELLRLKQNEDGTWNLERKIHNMVSSIGALDKPNQFITKRAREVLAYYANYA